MKDRLIKGKFQFKSKESAVIGRGIAKKLNLKVGDSFHIVLPKVDKEENFQKKQARLYVEGILDMGFHDF